MYASTATHRTLHRSASVAVVALGLLVLAGWAAHLRWLVLAPYNLVAIVPGTALSFLMSGLAMLALGTSGPSRHHVVRSLAAALLVFQIAGLLVLLSPTPSLLDFGTGGGWLQDANPFPGRMAPNTRLGFLLISVLLLSLARPVVDGRQWLPPAMLASVFIVAATGIISFLLTTDLFLPWQHARMALPTAVGMLCVALAGWAAWQARVHGQPIPHAQRILRTSALIATPLVIVAGLSGFAALGSFAQDAISAKLAQSLQVRSTVLDEQQRTSVALAQAFVARPDLTRNAAGLAAGTSAQAQAGLEAALSDIVGSGFRGASVIGPQGRMLGRSGVLSRTPAMAAPLDRQGRTALLWDGQFVLRITVPLRNAGSTLLLEQTMPGFTRAWEDTAQLGHTGESVLCIHAGPSLRCFRSRVDPRVFSTPATVGGQRLPVALALDGQAGTTSRADYSGREVMASFRPIGAGRLGMVVKQDTDELAAPIRNALLWMLPLLLGLVLAALWLLKSRVNPLGLELERLESEAREARDEVNAILRAMSDGLLIVDAENRIVAVNRAAAAMFDYPVEDLIGRDLRLLIPPEMRGAHDAEMRRYLGGEPRITGRGRVELKGLRRDATEFPLELSVDAIPHDGKVRLVGTMRDITQRKQAEQAIAFERERLRVTLHSIGDAVITTDTAARVNYLNPVAESLTGWSSAEALGRPIEEVFPIFHGEGDNPAPSPVEFVLSTGAIGGLAHDTMLLQRNGARIAIEDSAAPIRDIDHTLVGVVLVFHDVTQARAMASKMTYEASHDPLTDLINRREFERQLADILDGQGSQSKGHALLYIDLDQFKIVNDTAGHQAGDELLRQVSALLQFRLRTHDDLARLGGDEFAVLLRDCPVGPALRVAESLRQAVADYRFTWQGTVFAVGASIGVMPFNAGQPMALILSAADSACYIAKEQGRNRVYLHQQADDDVVRRTGDMNWTSRIHAALAEGRFALYGQWIVPVDAELEAHQDSPRHCELLLRMLDEAGELVPPMAFIPAAERYGLMPAIDRWVVEHAFAAMADARADGHVDLQFSINLSGASLNDSQFLTFIETQFAAAAIPYGSICFEITETAAIASLARAREFIDRLRSQGCQFSLDDFGTGLSSFAYLKSLRVDFLKIDGSFIRNIADDPIERTMVDAINRVGQEMGLRTIAEFVENDAILTALRSLGVDYAQGYGIAVPTPLDLALAMSHTSGHLVRG